MAPSARRWPSAAAAAVPLVAAAPATAAPATAAPEPGRGESLTAPENGPKALRSDARTPESYNVLVFTKTDGTRRASIQDGMRVIRSPTTGPVNLNWVEFSGSAGA
jgi:cytochrome c